VGAEGATDDFAQRLGAVDDEQPADLGIKPTLDQIVDERLHDGGVLSCSFDQGERVFVAFSIDAEGSDQHQVVVWCSDQDRRSRGLFSVQGTACSTRAK
jgi:hypothetical protein